MKILHVIARLNLGGTARWLETLTAQQAAVGHQISVAAGQVGPDETEYVGSGTLPLIRIPRLGRKISPLDDVNGMRQLRDLIGDLKPDIVNTHTAKAGVVGRLAAISLGRRRPPVVHTVHGHLLYGYFSSASVRAIITIERHLAKRTDLLLAAGVRVRRDLISAGISPPDKVQVVHPGLKDFKKLSRLQAQALLDIPSIESAPHNGLKSQPVVGWLARLVAIKRPDRLLAVAESLPQATFLVGGDGPLRSEIQNHRLENVRVLGWCDPALFWSACDIGLLTSDNEALPYSLLEAALAALPVVSTNVGSASEVVIDGLTGVTTPLSVEALSSSVRELIEDPLQAARMGQAARQRVLTEFSPDKMLEEHTAAYKMAIGLHASRFR